MPKRSSVSLPASPISDSVAASAVVAPEKGAVRARVKEAAKAAAKKAPAQTQAPAPVVVPEAEPARRASVAQAASPDVRRVTAGDLPLQLDKVNFRLHKLTNLMSRPFFGQFAKAHALSLTEWRCIVVLAHRPGSASQDLCEQLGTLPMSISRAVATLRQRELVEEARDPDNHRRVLLQLTPSGWALFDAIAPQAEANNRVLFGILEPQELAQFLQTLDKLTAQAERFTSRPYPDAIDGSAP